ncbi:MAG: hypothetical protein JSS14_24435 [Proteobacteria bacterium]|nr:hypothetical protein [Pseudomonadota bacterium]
MILPDAQQLVEFVRRTGSVQLNTPSRNLPFSVQAAGQHGLVVMNSKGNARNISLAEVENFLVLSSDVRHDRERRKRSFNSSYLIAIVNAYENHS